MHQNMGGFGILGWDSGRIGNDSWVDCHSIALPSISCTIVTMEMVADTNIFLAVVLDESEKSRIIQLTAGATVMAPEILPYEIGNALSAMVKRRRLCHAEALRAEHSAMQIPVRRVEIEI